MLRKRDLKALPVIRGSTEKLLSAAAEIVTVAGSEILHIDVHNDGELLVRYYADKGTKKWITLGEKSKWTQMGLSSAVNYELSSGDYVNFQQEYYRIYQIQGDIDFTGYTDMILQYFGKRFYGSAGHTIADWETSCRADKREKAYESKQRRIDDLMNRVPEIPEDFKAWMGREIFDDFLYTRKDGKKTEYICTACGKKGSRKMKVRQGQMAQCPRCGKELKVRSLGRKYKPQHEGIVVLQAMDIPRDKRDPLYKIIPTKTVWVERQLDVLAYALEGKKDYTIYEDMRAIVPKGETWGKVYYGELHDGLLGHQCFWTANPAQKRWRKSYLYPGNLDTVLGLANMSHSGLDILARKNVKINVNMFITMYHKREWIEYLIKAGLYRLVQDISDNYVHDELIKKSGRNLQECLMLDGAGVCRMKQLNGGVRTLEWLRVEKKLKCKVSKESLDFFCRHSLGPWTTGVDKMLKYFSPNRLANYIRKQTEVTGFTVSQVVGEYADYMSMAKRLKKQLDNEMVYKPKNVHLAHNECMALLKKYEVKVRADEVRRKFQEAEENLRAAAEKYEFANEKYTIRAPRTIEDIIVEGATLGHCIDRTDIYFDRIQHMTSLLVFLRQTESPDAPWYTLEIEPGGTIRQKRTVGNTQKDEDVKAFTPFLREWQKHILKRMNAKDKELAKASKEARTAEYGLLRKEKKLVRNGLLQGQLLVDVLEKDLMEAI